MRTTSLIIVFLIGIQMNYAQETFADVKNWAANFYTNTHTLDSQDSTRNFHVFFIDKLSLDTVSIFLYHIGINISHSVDLLLIKRLYPNNRITYQVINGANSIQEVYDFFAIYKEFSCETKTKCYERIITDFDPRYKLQKRRQ